MNEQPKRSLRRGTCIGAFVGGGVHIGNDVMICANAFVDFDVPDDSLVIGNPGVIHRKKNATVDYMRIEGLRGN